MNKSHVYQEKRKFNRVRLSIGVVYRVDEPLAIRLVTNDREIEARLLDLSEGGIAILSEYDIPVSTVLQINFTLFKIDAIDIGFYGPMNIKGEVRSNVLVEDKSRRLGICFIHIDDEDKREIINFVKMVGVLKNAQKE